MKEEITLNEKIEEAKAEETKAEEVKTGELKIRKKNPVLEKLGNIFFGLFVTVLFTLPLWCILMIVIYFVNNRM